MDLLGELRVYPHALADDMVLDDDTAALADLLAYRALGGTTLVEQTPKGMGRDLARLVRFAEASGVTVVRNGGGGSSWAASRSLTVVVSPVIPMRTCWRTPLPMRCLVPAVSVSLASTSRRRTHAGPTCRAWYF